MRLLAAMVLSVLVAVGPVFATSTPLIYEGSVDLQGAPMNQSGRPQWSRIPLKVGNTGKARLYTYTGTNVLDPSSYTVTWHAGPSRDDSGQISVTCTSSSTYVDFEFLTNTLAYPFTDWYSALKFVSGTTIISTPEGLVSCSGAPEVDGGSVAFTYNRSYVLWNFTNVGTNGPYVFSETDFTMSTNSSGSQVLVFAGSSSATNAIPYVTFNGTNYAVDGNALAISGTAVTAGGVSALVFSQLDISGSNFVTLTVLEGSNFLSETAAAAIYVNETNLWTRSGGGVITNVDVSSPLKNSGIGDNVSLSLSETNYFMKSDYPNMDTNSAAGGLQTPATSNWDMAATYLITNYPTPTAADHVIDKGFADATYATDAQGTIAEANSTTGNTHTTQISGLSTGLGTVGLLATNALAPGFDAGMTNLVEDTTPELGGDLDASTNNQITFGPYDAVVTGTLIPDWTGAWIKDGLYGVSNRQAYARIDGAYYAWPDEEANPDFYYQISTSKDGDTLWQGTSDAAFDGGTFVAQGTNSGTPTITAWGSYGQKRADAWTVEQAEQAYTYSQTNTPVMAIEYAAPLGTTGDLARAGAVVTITSPAIALTAGANTTITTNGVNDYTFASAVGQAQVDEIGVLATNNQTVSSANSSTGNTHTGQIGGLSAGLGDVGLLATNALAAGDAVTDLTGTTNRLLYIDGSGNVTELVHGTASQVLTSTGPGGNPAWSNAAAGSGASRVGYTVYQNEGWSWEPNSGSSTNNNGVFVGWCTAHATDNSKQGWSFWTSETAIQDRYAWRFCPAPANASSVGSDGIKVLARTESISGANNYVNILVDDASSASTTTGLLSTSASTWKSYPITIPAAWSSDVPTVTLDGIACRGFDFRALLFTSNSNHVQMPIVAVDWD